MKFSAINILTLACLLVSNYTEVATAETVAAARLALQCVIEKHKKELEDRSLAMAGEVKARVEAVLRPRVWP